MRLRTVCIDTVNTTTVVVFFFFILGYDILIQLLDLGPPTSEKESKESQSSLAPLPLALPW